MKILANFFRLFKKESPMPITVSILWFDDNIKPLDVIEIINKELERPQHLWYKFVGFIKKTLVPVDSFGNLFRPKEININDPLLGIEFKTQKRSTGMFIAEILLELLTNHYSYRFKKWDGWFEGVLITFDGLSLADILEILDKQEGR